MSLQKPKKNWSGGGLLKNEQWQKHFVPGRAKHDIHRCLQARVEGTFKYRKNRGSMELGGKGKNTLKYAGLKAAFLALQVFLPQLKRQFSIDN